MPIFPEIGQVAHPSLDADTALFYAHLSRKARTGERGIVGDGGKKRESGSRPFCDSDGFRACMSAREKRPRPPARRWRRARRSWQQWGLRHQARGSPPQRRPNWSGSQSVCEKVESSRQWSEVKRGGPRKGERKRSWIGREGRGRSESGERIKLNFAHFLKGGRGLCGGANDVCLLRAMGRCFLSVFDICSTDCVALPSARRPFS